MNSEVYEVRLSIDVFQLIIQMHLLLASACCMFHESRLPWLGQNNNISDVNSIANEACFDNFRRKYGG
jgi:hypothetical protein